MLQARLRLQKIKHINQDDWKDGLRAQDSSWIVDLDNLVVLISSTTTTSIDRRRVLIDDLWGQISDLNRLVSEGTNFTGRSVKEVYGGALNSAIISLAASPRKDRSHSRCSCQMLYMNVWTSSSKLLA